MSILKKKPLTAEQIEEAGRLREIYKRQKKNIKFTQHDIADELGAGQTAVSHYLNAINPLNPKAASAFSKVLGVSISEFSPRLASQMLEMVQGENVDDSAMGMANKSRIKHRSVPVLSSARASKWNKDSTIHSISEPTDFLQTNVELSSSGFAFVVLDTAMSPEFNQGDVIFFDPEVDEIPGDFVMAQVGGSEEAIFRRYRLISAAGDEPVFELFPLNNVHALHRSDVEKIRVIGVMVEHRKYRQAPKR